jgi:hypothetical protein
MVGHEGTHVWPETVCVAGTAVVVVVVGSLVDAVDAPPLVDAVELGDVVVVVP